MRRVGLICGDRPGVFITPTDNAPYAHAPPPLGLI